MFRLTTLDGVTNNERWPELASLQPGVIPLRPLAAGEIFAAAWTTLRRHVGVLFGATFVLVALGQILATWIALPMLRELPRLPAKPNPTQLNEQLMAMAPITAILAVISGFALLLATAVASAVVGKAVLGKPITFGEALRELAPQAIVLLTLSMGISALATLGLVVIAPGIWVFVLLSLAIPAAVLERANIGAAANRSRALVKNNWWRVFGMQTAVVLASYGALMATSWLTTAIFGPPESVLSPGLLIQILVSTATVAYAGLVIALIYVTRRFETDDLALELARAAGLKP